MKKTEMEAVLNKAADSISLHDGTLLCFRMINNTITFTLNIGEYHYIVNDLEPFIGNVKDETVLTLKFDGVKNIQCEFCDDFVFEHAGIEIAEYKDGIYSIAFSDSGYCPGHISFGFDSFRWEVAGEFDFPSLDAWCKENGISCD